MAPRTCEMHLSVRPKRNMNDITALGDACARLAELWTPFSHGATARTFARSRNLIVAHNKWSLQQAWEAWSRAEQRRLARCASFLRNQRIGLATYYLKVESCAMRSHRHCPSSQITTHSDLLPNHLPPLSR